MAAVVEHDPPELLFPIAERDDHQAPIHREPRVPAVDPQGALAEADLQEALRCPLPSPPHRCCGPLDEQTQIALRPGPGVASDVPRVRPGVGVGRGHQDALVGKLVVFQALPDGRGERPGGLGAEHAQIKDDPHQRRGVRGAQPPGIHAQRIVDSL